MAPYDLPQTNREGMSANSKQKVLRSSGPRNNNRHVSNAMDLYRTPEPLPPVEPDSLSPIHEESPINSLAGEYASVNGNENNSPLSNEALGLSGLSGVSIGDYAQQQLNSEDEEQNLTAASAASHEELGRAGAAALARFKLPNNNNIVKNGKPAATNKRSRRNNRKGSRRNDRKGSRKDNRKNGNTRRSGRRTRRSKN